MRKSTILTLFLFLFSALSAQNNPVPPLEREVTIHIDNQTIESALTEISAQTDVVFSYNPIAINSNDSVNLDISDKTVRLALNLLFNDKVSYKVKGKYVILKENPAGKEKNEGKQMYEGYVYDLTTGKKLTNVSVYNKQSMASAVTDQYGFFSMELPVNTTLTSIGVSKVGYSDTLLSGVSEDGSIRALEVYLDRNDSIHHADHKKFRDLKNIAPLWLVSRNTLVNAANINDSIFRSVQFSLIPGISTNRFLGGNVVNDVSINLLTGYLQGVNVVEFGGVMNIVRGDVKYAEFGGVGNIVGGNVRGVQAGGVLNLANSVNGVQIGGVVNNATERADAQFSGFYNSCDKSVLQTAGFINLARGSGAQIAGFINLANKSRLQLAGAVNVADSADVQIAGVINTTRHDCAMQVAGVINHADSIRGMQLGGVGNISTGDANIQISGIFNKARYVRTFQLSLINLADSSDGLSLGLFNFIKSGFRQLELSADEIFPFNAAFRAGTNQFHTMIMAGMSPFKNPVPYLNVGYGIGTSLSKSGKLLFDITLSSKYIFTDDNFSFNHNLNQLYAGIDRKLWSKFSIAAGITLNYYLYDNTDTRLSYSTLPPYSFWTHSFSNGLASKSWIGGRIALRFF